MYILLPFKTNTPIGDKQSGTSSVAVLLKAEHGITFHWMTSRGPYCS